MKILIILRAVQSAALSETTASPPMKAQNTHLLKNTNQFTAKLILILPCLIVC